MTEFYSDPLVTLLHGDCIEVMATLPADSVDAVVTDPPYGLEFMGKEWDSLGLKRGRHVGKDRKMFGDTGADHPAARNTSMPSFGSQNLNPKCAKCGLYEYGPTPEAAAARGRTHHKCMCEVPDLRGRSTGPIMQAWHELWATEAIRVTKPGGYLLAFGGTRTHHRLVCALEDAGWIIRDELDWIYASGFPKGKANLKPAHEPIVLARKPGPLRPLAIDESRIGMSEQDAEDIRNAGGFMKAGYEGSGAIGVALQGRADGTLASLGAEPHPSGRWPSNVLLSDPELFDEPNPYVVGSGATASFNVPVEWQSGGEGSLYGDGINRREAGTIRNAYGDSGGYSRFFIVPKADRAERERGLVGADGTRIYGGGKGNNTRRCRQCGSRTFSPQVWPACGHEDYEWVDKLPIARANVHPTVKPIDLMRHLVRLVTPAGGVVLDPFLGSGTTCLAASEEGFRSIGIEREAEYLEIAKGRLMATPMGLGLEVI